MSPFRAFGMGVLSVALVATAVGCGSSSSGDEEMASTSGDATGQAVVKSTASYLATPGVYLGEIPATLEYGAATWKLYGPRVGETGPLNSVSARMLDENGDVLIAAAFTIRESDGRIMGAALNTKKATPWTLEDVESALVRDAEAAFQASSDSADPSGDVSPQMDKRGKINCMRATLMAVGIGGGSVMGASMGLVNAGGATCLATMGAGCAVAVVGLLTAVATLGAFSLDSYLSCSAP